MHITSYTIYHESKSKICKYISISFYSCTPIYTDQRCSFLKICLKILSNGFCSHPTAAPDRRQYPFARIRGQKVKPRDFRRWALHWRISGTGNPIIVERYYGIYNGIYNDIIITRMGFMIGYHRESFNHVIIMDDDAWWMMVNCWLLPSPMVPNIWSHPLQKHAFWVFNTNREGMNFGGKPPEWCVQNVSSILSNSSTHHDNDEFWFMDWLERKLRLFAGDCLGPWCPVYIMW